MREALVLRRHVVPNALLPVVTLTALNIGFVLSGDITVEAVFSWPGLGKLMVDAINLHDFPQVQACILLLATTDRIRRSRRSLILSGLADIPIAFIFLSIGLLLWVYYQAHPDPTLPKTPEGLDVLITRPLIWLPSLDCWRQ